MDKVVESSIEMDESENVSTYEVHVTKSCSGVIPKSNFQNVSCEGIQLVQNLIGVYS